MKNEGTRRAESKKTRNYVPDRESLTKISLCV